MNTGISRGLIAAAACLGLAACDSLGFDGFGGGDSQSFAAQRATLEQGTVSLIPPNGYCIDIRSLRQSFALIARCDVLGAPLPADKPLAIITATTLAMPADTAIDPDDLRADAETVLTRSETDDLSMVQVQGTPPSPDMRDTYWRGAGRVGEQVLGLALYQAADTPDLGDTALELLVETMERTSAQTQADAAARQDNSATALTNQTANAFRAGLFE